MKQETGEDEPVSEPALKITPSLSPPHKLQYSLNVPRHTHTHTLREQEAAGPRPSTHYPEVKETRRAAGQSIIRRAAGSFKKTTESSRCT